MTLQNIITTLGIPTIVVALIYVGRKLQVLGEMEQKFTSVEKKLDNTYERVVRLEERVNTIWIDTVAPASSPRQLNEAGIKILDESGIKEIISEKKNALLEEVKKSNPQMPTMLNKPLFL